MKYQPRTKQKKYQTTLRAITQIKEAVRRDAIRWNCSESWIWVTVAGAFYNIDVIKPFETKNLKLIKKRKRA